MSDREWRPARSAPENVLVRTKIDDDQGLRNEQPIKRRGGLWWLPDGSYFLSEGHGARRSNGEMTMKTSRQDELQGMRVRIAFTSNRFASADVGKTGTVTGYAPLDMVIVTLEDGREYWANTSNLDALPPTGSGSERE